MRIQLSGAEEIEASRERLWQGLNDPAVLAKCIPGCRTMTEIAPDRYRVEMQLKVGAVGGGFEGEVGLSEKIPDSSGRIFVSGMGSLGSGSGTAAFTIIAQDAGRSRLEYQGEGEVGGLVAGVGQRILGSVAKHLAKQFFSALREHFAQQDQETKVS